jgi:hypothetical protein
MLHVYTLEEIEHLDSLMENALIERFDVGAFDPAYYRHCAAGALHDGKRKLAAEFLEHAEALECGMENGGETLP